MWYVIQVFTGKEDETVANIRRMVPRSACRECFNPTFRTQKRVAGAWKTLEQPLFPGYVIADSSDPKALAAALRAVPGYTHILASEQSYSPLAREEQQWISDFTQEGSRVIGISTGVIEGDKVIVTQGPLVNRTAAITKIDRHKRIAMLRIEMCGRSVEIKLGLNIIRKSPE